MTHEQILVQARKDLKAIYKQAKEKLKALEVAPQVELEVGKWYWIEEVIICITRLRFYDVFGYGLNTKIKHWIAENNDPWTIAQIKREATPQEVEKALIEEAKRRYKVGCSIKPLVPSVNQWTHLEIKSDCTTYDIPNNRLFYGGWLVFNKGQWATIIEQDKFAELKEAHRNGAVIESMPKNWIGDWNIATNPIWDGDNYENRIKPDFEVGTKFILNNSIDLNIYTITKIDDDLVFIGWDGKNDRVDYDYSNVSSNFRDKIWIEYTESQEKPKVIPRLGRKQERVILDDNNNGQEVCTFHEKYKHLAPLVVEFLKGKDLSCQQ